MTEKSGAILAYQGLITSKKILPDEAQVKLLQKLDALGAQLERFYRSRGVVGRLLGGHRQKPKGLYIYGGVGRGKSMMMDLFYENLDKSIPALRTHFHAFMSDVHTRIKNWHDMDLSDRYPDVMKYIAGEIARHAKLLCFDEMQINDIADAMMIGRLFEALMEHDVVIVATSNRHPDQLYKDGLQRDRFIPFIEMFKKEMDIVELKGEKDYRMHHIGGLSQTYFTPLGVDASAFLEKAYNDLSGGGKTNPKVIEVRGRKINALKSHGDVGFFTFKALCDANLGSEDYMEIARQFNTVLIAGIPKMKKDDYNLAIRFTKLIDELYEHKCKLICSAEATPEDLYKEGIQSFEFARTASRLNEMQGKEYLEKEHRG